MGGEVFEVLSPLSLPPSPQFLSSFCRLSTRLCRLTRDTRREGTIMTLTLSTVYTGKCWLPCTAAALQLPRLCPFKGPKRADPVNPRAGDACPLALLWLLPSSRLGSRVLTRAHSSRLPCWSLQCNLKYRLPWCSGLKPAPTNDRRCAGEHSLKQAQAGRGGTRL